MKTKTQKLKRAFALSAFVFSALFITLNMNACGGKDKNNGGGGGGGGGTVVPNCPTCLGGQSNLGAALGQNSRIALGLSFGSTQTLPPDAGTYSGTVTATGFLHIKTAMGCNTSIGIPAGIFGVSTVTPGNWYGAWGSSIMQGLVMDASGIRIVVGLGAPYISAQINGVQPYRTGPNGEQYPSYMTADVYIESVNGQPCNSFPIIERIN